MVDIKTFEVDAKLSPVSVELWRVKFGNYGNHTILILTVEATVVKQ
jgi:hypothetical protein